MRLDPFESEASDGQIRKLIAWVMIDGSTGTHTQHPSAAQSFTFKFQDEGGGREGGEEGGGGMITGHQQIKKETKIEMKQQQQKKLQFLIDHK